MQVIKSFSEYILPTFILVTIIYAAAKKVNVFDAFLCGAKDGIGACIKILPALCGLLCAISMFKASSALDFFIAILKPIIKAARFPEEILPLALLRPISGSGSLAILSDILKSYGPDSFIGKSASVIMGSTETTFYAATIYFGSVGIKKMRHTLPCAILADLTGIFVGIYVTKLLLM